MSVDELKNQIATLPPKEQDQITAFLFQLRHANDAEYHAEITRRLNDKDPSHWLTPEEAERELDRRDAAK